MTNEEATGELSEKDLAKWHELMVEMLRKRFSDKELSAEWKRQARLENPPHWCAAYKIKSDHYKEDK